MEHRILLDGGRYYEGPRWHGGRLWVSDTLARTVLSVGESGDVVRHAKVDDIPCGLGFTTGGDLVALTMFGRQLLRIRDGAIDPYADLSGIAAGTIDDMIIDGHGRAYVGDLGFNLLAGPETRAVGRLILVMPDGTARVVADELFFPNGIAVSDDGQRLFVAEMSGGNVAEFAIAADGSLTLARRFGSFTEPDGICLDRDGAVWVAQFLGDAFVRVDTGGNVLERIETPGRRAVACVLGGADRTNLYGITTETTPEDLMKGVSKSRIDVYRVSVPGAGFP
jgi:sugar lactone lactonase YvrE